MQVGFPYVLHSTFRKANQVHMLDTFATDSAAILSFFHLFHEANFNIYFLLQCTKIVVMLYSLFVILLSVVYLILAVAVHEFAHAFVADRLGDPTARAAGRLTLNPFAHIDLVGTLILPLSLMLLSGGNFAFGWGKPTPFDPYNLKKPRRDTGLISFAGPLSNLLLAGVVALVVHFLTYPAALLLVPFVITNVSLALFNLIPVGPLDGQKIVFGLLPRDLAYEYQSVMNRYGTLILILLIFPVFGSSPIMAILDPAIRFLVKFLIP